MCSSFSLFHPELVQPTVLTILKILSPGDLQAGADHAGNIRLHPHHLHHNGFQPTRAVRLLEGKFVVLNKYFRQFQISV